MVDIQLLNSARDELGQLIDWHHVPRVGEFLHCNGKPHRVAEVHYVVQDDVVPIGHGNNQVVLVLDDAREAEIATWLSAWTRGSL